MLLFAFYLLKVIICSGVLFAYYWLLLRNKIFHQYNRFYLLAAVALSLLAPLVQINIWHYANTPAPTIKLLQVVTSSNEYLDEIVLTAHKNNFTTEQLATLLYLATSIVFLSLFIQVFIKIRTLLKHHRQTIVDNVHFVNTTAKGTPFSFLQYIFWNDHIDITTTTGNQIFKHELAHVQQKHSYDKLFINAVLIFCWCNPFFWLIRKELNIIHEFMADKISVEDNDTEAFAAMILQATYPQYQFPLSNPFFYSPIKRRLMMLTKNNNTKAGYITRILVLPLAVLLFAAFTLKTKTIQTSPGYKGKQITVVLDAGHGGKDFGALSPDGNVTEKDMVLSIVQRIKAFNNNPNINIVLTRNTDVYSSPQEKVDFTNAQKPDLFISFHIDASKSPDSSSYHSGLSAWVSKNAFSNSSKSKLFASAILQEFNAAYELPVLGPPNQSETGIWVLQATNCPAVIIEAGFITNQKDLKYLQTAEAKETIAKNVLAAIEKYAVQLGSNITITDPVVKDTVPEAISKKTNQLPANTLYVLDGKIQPASFKLNSISSNDIESINVLKDKTAIDKNGNRAANGVIEITMKKKKIDTTNFLNSGDNKIFTQVENEPKFPGGDSAWRNYLKKNLNPGIPVDNGAPAGTYRVIVKFIVNKDGAISDVHAETKFGYGMDSAAVALITKGPNWQPALQNYHVVTAYKKQPITFVIEEQ